MIELQETEKSAWVDVQFLKQAVDQVLSSLLLLLSSSSSSSLIFPSAPVGD